MRQSVPPVTTRRGAANECLVRRVGETHQLRHHMQARKVAEWFDETLDILAR